jgi:hypothetical protein
MPVWFWWQYASGGILGWAAVGFVWWHTGNIAFAADVVCRGVAFLGSWAGYMLAAFWLASTAFAFGLGLLVAPIMAIRWHLQRRRSDSN